MSRNGKFSKETKIKACEDYQVGNENFNSISKTLGVRVNTVREWYFAFAHHGSSAFDTSDRNKSYTNLFKTGLVEMYLSGECSMFEIGGKYNLSLSMVRRWIKKYNEGIALKDYDPKGEVYTMKSRKTTHEERLEIVKWVIENNFNYKDAAEKYGVKYAAIYQWVRKYRNGKESSLEYKKRGPKGNRKIDESELDDIGKLKMELERERILRKQAEFRLELLKKKEEFEKKLHSRK